MTPTSASTTYESSAFLPTTGITRFQLPSASDKNADMRAFRGVIGEWATLAELGKRYASENGWIFRGQPFPFGLRPKIGREGARRNVENEPIPYGEREEQTMFAHFKRRSRPYLGQKPEGDLEWLSVAQHHGLPTRLLDWSESFLAAAFFAVEKAGVDGPAAVFAAQIEDRASPLEDPFHLQRIKIYRPPHIAPRIAAQQGIFTVHPEPAVNASFPKLELWLIPDKGTCFGIKRTLDVCGVNRAALFPDVDGLAAYLDWRYKWSEVIALAEP